MNPKNVILNPDAANPADREIEQFDSIRPDHRFPPAVPPAPFSEATLRQLAAQLKFELPKAVVTKLDKLESDFDRAFNALGSINLTWKQLESDTARAAEALAEGRETNFRCPSADQMKSERRGTMRAMKGVARNLVNEGIELVRPHHARFIKEGREFITRLETSELEQAHAWGVPFEPSSVLRGLRLALRVAEQKLPSPGNGLYQRPKSLMGYVL